MRRGFAVLRRMLLKLLGGFIGSGTRDDVVGQVALMFITVFLLLVLENQATIVSPPSDGPDEGRSTIGRGGKTHVFVAGLLVGIVAEERHVD